MKTTLSGGRIIGSDRPAVLTIDDAFVSSIESVPNGGHDVIDIEGLTLAPGLIDIQINGAYGSDFTAHPESIWSIGARLPEQGVTGFLPTIITSPPGSIDAARSVLTSRPYGYRGAEPIGLHLEGPMLSARRPGVHDVGLMRQPSLELIQDWSSGGGVAMVTIAPELSGSWAVIESLVDRGVVVAAGHTAANMDEAEAGFRYGITAVTHLFNAMEPFDHHAPGLIGAVVRDPVAVAGIIADGLHSDPAVVLAAWRMLGPRLALVTDAMAAAGLGDGAYELGPVAVTVEGGRVTDVSGRLAGSTLTLDRAVRNLIDFAGCSPVEALAAASSVPARLLRLSDRGRIAVGNRADLVVLDDAMEVAATMVGGRFLYDRDGRTR